MTAQRGSIVSLLKATISDFGEDECGVRSAALAYYTIFALPPLLILLVRIAGMIWSQQEVQGALEGQFGSVLGASGKSQIHDMMVHGTSAGGGTFATIASAIGLLLGATGLFLSLQEALNRAWGVKPDPAKGGIKVFIGKRILSAGMVLGIGFLLAVSLALTAGIAAVGGAVGGGAIPEVLLQVVTAAASFAVLSLLFAALFKLLPDAEIAWNDVWVGGAVTGALFTVGKVVLGIYLGRSKPGDAYGAASALAAMLVWAYYAGMILLLGAEFTQQWVKRRGSGIEPKEGAVRVVETEQLIRPGEQGSGQGGDHPAPRPPTPAPSAARGGIGSWILGLPVLYLIFRRERNRR